MASTRTATLFLTRTSRCAASNTIVRTFSLRSQINIQRRGLGYSEGLRGKKLWSGQRRRSSGESGSAGNIQYAYQDIVDLIEKPSQEKILIDTREPHELKDTGRIPGAINIPVASQSDAYFISDEDFEDRFGFERPGKDKECIFYCKAGVRSRSAAELARQAGWGRVGEYNGSWNDWIGNGGVVER